MVDEDLIKEGPMMKKIAWILVVVAAIGIAWLVWGQQKPASPGAAEKAGAALDQAAENTAETAKAAWEKTGEAVDDAAAKTKDVADKVVDKTGEALEKTGAAVERTGENLQD